MSDTTPTEYAGPELTLAFRMAECLRDDVLNAISGHVGQQVGEAELESIRQDIVTTMLERYGAALNVSVGIKVTEDGKLQPTFSEEQFFISLTTKADGGD